MKKPVSPSCPGCENETFESSVVQPDGVKFGYSVIICSKCGAIVLPAIINEIHSLVKDIHTHLMGEADQKRKTE